MRNYNIKFKFECSIEATTKESHREKKRLQGRRKQKDGKAGKDGKEAKKKDDKDDDEEDEEAIDEE